jgi:hypothetical protein
MGSPPKVNHPHTPLFMEAVDKLLLKGELQTHLTPLMGQVHKKLTSWMELILHHYPK